MSAETVLQNGGQNHCRQFFFAAKLKNGRLKIRVGWVCSVISAKSRPASRGMVKGSTPVGIAWGEKSEPGIVFALN